MLLHHLTPELSAEARTGRRNQREGTGIRPSKPKLNMKLDTASVERPEPLSPTHAADFLSLGRCVCSALPPSVMPDGAGLPREVKDGQGDVMPVTPSHKDEYLCEQQQQLLCQEEFQLEQDKSSDCK